MSPLHPYRLTFFLHTKIQPVDASNHIIMDYSIHDAIEAGFKKMLENGVYKADLFADL